MSEKRYTKEKPDLPYDDYTVVARLSPFIDQPYGQSEAATLMDALQLEPKDVEVQDDQLYLRLRLGRVAGEDVVANEAAYLLHRGLARMAIDPDISVGVDFTAEVAPCPSLAVAFPYLQNDISEAVDHQLRQLTGQPVQEFNFDLELQHLADH